MNKALTINTGKTDVQCYLDPLLSTIVAGEIDPSFVATHQEPLEDAPAMYERFNEKDDECINVVLTP